jgi:hypothetical protein
MMKKYSVLVFFLILLAFNIYSLDASSDSNLSERTVLLMPCYYINYDKDYDFLGILIRDSIKAKLDTRKIFKFINFEDTYNAVDKLKLSSKDYINKDKTKDTALITRADVILITKYSVTNKKIMIVTEAYDILNSQTVVTSTINGDVGPDIFDIIDNISEDIASKMAAAFQKIDKVKLADFFKNNTSVVEKTIEKQNVENKNTETQKSTVDKIITQITNMDEIFKLKYSGVSLGSRYDLVELVIKNLNYEKKIIKNKETKTIIFKGCLNSIFATQETILNFKKDILTDVWLYASETTEANSDTDLKNQLSSLRNDFGIESLSGDGYNWNDKKMTLELVAVKASNRRMFIFIHGYLQNENVSIARIIDRPEYQVYQKAFNFTVGAGIRLYYEGKWANIFAFEKTSASSPLSADMYTQNYSQGPANFNILKLNVSVPIALNFYNKKYSSGLLIEPGYSASITGSPSLSTNNSNNNSSNKSNNPIYIHSVSFNISAKHKFNFNNIGQSISLEYGIISQFDYLQNMDETQYKFYDSFSSGSGSSKYYQLYISNMYFEAGPMLNLVFEFQQNNYSHEVGLFIGGNFGFGILKMQDKYLMTSANSFIFGVNYRFNYYYMSVK